MDEWISLLAVAPAVVALGRGLIEIVRTHREVNILREETAEVVGVFRGVELSLGNELHAAPGLPPSFDLLLRASLDSTRDAVRTSGTSK